VLAFEATDGAWVGRTRVHCSWSCKNRSTIRAVQDLAASRIRWASAPRRAFDLVRSTSLSAFQSPATSRAWRAATTRSAFLDRSSLRIRDHCCSSSTSRSDSVKSKSSLTSSRSTSSCIGMSRRCSRDSSSGPIDRQSARLASNIWSIISTTPLSRAAAESARPTSRL